MKEIEKQLEGIGKFFTGQKILTQDQLQHIREFIIKDIKENLLIERHLEDIQKIFPGQLLLEKKQLELIRGISSSSINREKAAGRGIPYKDEGGRIMYPIRDIAKWLSNTVKTSV